MTDIEIIEDIFTVSNNPEIIVKDLTLQVTQKVGKLLVEDINLKYLLFINLDYVISGKSLFIQLPNGRSLTLKIV
jgi:hypothetical protein